MRIIATAKTEKEARKLARVEAKKAGLAWAPGYWTDYKGFTCTLMTVPTDDGFMCGDIKWCFETLKWVPTCELEG